MQGKVWEFKELRFSVWATSGSSTIQFKTDLPGGQLVTRKTVTVPQSTERITDTSPLDTYEGKQFAVRFVPNGAGYLRVYSATVLARPIGVYLDGGKGDFYETQPITLGA